MHAGVCHHIHVREYVKGDWELKIDGQHVMYSGTLAAIKQVVTDGVTPMGQELFTQREV